MKKRVIVIDAETTGLDARNDEILQLTILSDSGQILFNEFIRPTKHTDWPEAEKINHITYDMVKDCQPILYHAKEIQHILDSADVIVGYNHSFDMAFLASAGIKSDVKKNYDLMLEFSQLRGEWDAENNHYKWYSLKECADYLGYRWGSDQSHNSLADCKAVLYSYKKMIAGESGKGGTINERQLQSSFQAEKKTPVSLIFASVIILIIAVISAVSIKGSAKRETVLAKTGVLTDPHYIDYLELESSGKLDNEGRFLSNPVPKHEGEVHVTFAVNSLLNISYSTSPEMNIPIDQDNCYMHPGDKIFVKETQPNGSDLRYHHLSEVSIYGFDSPKPNKLISIGAEGGCIITIPEGYSEIGIVPLGKYESRILHLNAYLIKENGDEEEFPGGQWAVNGTNCREQIELPPQTDYAVTYEFNHFAEKYYYDEKSSSPNATYDKKNNTLFFEKISASDEHPTTDFIVKFRSYVDLKIDDAHENSIADNITDIFNKPQNLTIRLEEEDGSWHDMPTNEKTIRLKHGQSVQVRVDNTYQLINGDDESRITIPSPNPMKGSSTHEYTLTIPDVGSDNYTLYIKKANSDPSKIYKAMEHDHALISLFYKTPDEIPILDGDTVPNENETVILKIVPENEGYYLEGISTQKDGTYRGEMSYSKYEVNIRTLLDKLTVGQYVKLSLPDRGKYGRCTYKLDKKDVSGEAFAKPGQILEITYTVDQGSAVRLQDQKGSPKTEAVKTIQVTRSLEKGLNPDAYFTIIRG